MPKIKVNPDYYQILGIPDFSDALTIKKAYRRKALEHHPDRGGTDEMMQRINYIYEILSQHKSAYDNYLRQKKGMVSENVYMKSMEEEWRRQREEQLRAWFKVHVSGDNWGGTTSTTQGTWTSS